MPAKHQPALRRLQSAQRVDDRHPQALPDHGTYRGSTGGLDDRAAVHPRRTEVLVQALAVSVEAGQVDEIDLVKIAQLQLGPGLQRVPVRQHAYHVGAEQQFTVGATRYLLDLGQAQVMLLGHQ